MPVLSLLVDHLASSLPSLSFTDSQLLVCLCALTVHKIYNKFEVEPANFFVSFLLLGAVPMLPFPFVSMHLGSSISSVLLTYLLFYSVLILSIIMYRVSPLHPLAKHPGPLSLKVSKLATLLYTYDGKQHIFFKRLHDKYGPCVRIGPNELSIVDVDAIQPILGLDGTRKGPQYIAHVQPGSTPNIVTLRDVHEHRERRKLWNHAFTSTALKDYHPTVVNRVLQLVEELSKCFAHGSGEGKPVDLAKWMDFFTYDFMGDLVFNGGLELMRDGDDRRVVATLEQTMKAVGILEHIPWTRRLIWRLSLTSKDQARFINFAMKCLNDRKQKGSTKKDLFHFITNEDALEDMEVPPDQAINDTFTAIIAGADTTSTVLGGLFYYILTHREAYKRLQAEVDAIFPHGEGDPFDAVKLAGMPYLNAVMHALLPVDINEALRLQPPVPTSLQRSPLEMSGGKWVAGRFIPENAAVYVPPYVLHRDERYFSPSPNKFIPERWLDTAGSGRFQTNTAAFIPFSLGPANCAGKNLALLEMRMVVATLVQRFDMGLAGGYDPCEWEEELEDFFVMKVGKLPIVLTPRD